LPTPETVPFRLTRDIVDGFGPTGTEGAFTTVSETTLEVLRENSHALLTILSAVVSDPLYKWCISPVGARLRQRDDTGEEEFVDERITRKGLNSAVEGADHFQAAENESDAATRTIAKIHKKLQGFEDGTFGERLTVEGQVRMLINAARNPDNLCHLYHGWAPWL